MKQFRGRLFLCITPLVLSAIFVWIAYYNTMNPPQPTKENPNPEPPKLRFNLGVDLAGGTNLIYQVDPTVWKNMKPGEQQEFKADQLAAALKKRLDPNNLLEIAVRPIPGSSNDDPPKVEIVLPIRSGTAQGEEEILRVKRLITTQGKLEFRIIADKNDDPTGKLYADAAEKVKGYTPDKTTAPPPPDETAKARFEWKELSVKEVERRQNPEGRGVSEAEKKEARDRWSRLGWDSREETNRLGDGSSGKAVRVYPAYYHAPDVTWLEGGKERKGRHFILTKIMLEENEATGKLEQLQVTGDDLAYSGPHFDGTKLVVRFTMKTTGVGGRASGSERFGKLTGGEHVGRNMAIILDEKVESYPTLQSKLTDNGVITMGETGQKLKQAVDELVLVLRSGALPATLSQNPISELTTGPRLGADKREAGTIAVGIAFVAVVAFMCVYYRFAGFVASTALFANLLLTLGFLVVVKATITLPGLAGLVLMLGMAVDANVLIYERVREERERGASLVLAIRNGYDRAFPTIIDTHVTSIFTAIVLYAVGNDQLKGFGVVLTAGLLISLFTSLYLTRLIFDIWLYKGWLKELKMLKLLSKPNIDFMKWRFHWFTATVALAVLGLGLFVGRIVAWANAGEEGGGAPPLSIEFTGGTKYNLELTSPLELDEVRKIVESPIKGDLQLPDKEQTGGGRIPGEKLPDGTRLRDPSVNANFTKDKPPGTLYSVETPDKDPVRVREIVKRLFGKALKYVEVNGSDAAIGETDPPTPGDAKWKVFTLGFTNKLMSRDEIEAIVDRWLEEKGANLAEKKKLYTLTGTATFTLDTEDPATGKKNTEEREVETGFEKITLKLAVPENATAEELRARLVAALNQPVSDQLTNVDSSLSETMRDKAMWAILLSWLVVSLYLWFRFGNWTFGIAAVLCLMHDLLFAMGLIAACHWLAGNFFGDMLLIEDFKLDLAGIAALLTLVGYSVNDTIVVFDRIREVRGKSPDLTPQMINESVNQTLSRTLLTSFTTWLVVIVLYIWGGGGSEGIHLFSFVMVVGIVIGTYSSIYVASPLLLFLGEGKHHQRTRGTVQMQEATA